MNQFEHAALKELADQQVRFAPPAKRLALVTAGVVGLSRMYVGAHLPLDVAGGAALGLAVGGLVEMGESRTR